MKTFQEWLEDPDTDKTKYRRVKNFKERLEWYWTDYLRQTFESTSEKVVSLFTLPTKYADKAGPAYDNAPGNTPELKVQAAIATLTATSTKLIQRYNADAMPTVDNLTLCTYHAFSHMPQVPQEQRNNVLAFCTAWKTKRFAAKLAYDDTRCTKLMAIEYGLTKWSPMKLRDVPDVFTQPKTRLIISVFDNMGNIPPKYWQSGTAKKQFAIADNANLDAILNDSAAHSHCIYAEVGEKTKIQYYDNENEGGRATDEPSPQSSPGLQVIVWI